MNLDPTLVARIAFRFDARLRFDLAAGEYEEVCHRNALAADAGELNTCASHDFCDANMTMCDALTDCGITPDIDDERCHALWCAAWNLWKESTRRRDGWRVASPAACDQWLDDLRAAVAAGDPDKIADLLATNDRNGCFRWEDVQREFGASVTRDQWRDGMIVLANESIDAN